MNSLQKLYSLGQSVWYDNIQRSLLENGELAKLIQNGDIRGITSNPSIFNHAIGKSNDYDDSLTPMAWSGLRADDIFYRLAIEDIQAAADLFAPLYNETQGGDGFVSLEVNPNFANGTEETVTEAKKLWEMVGRPNVMIKIPATEEGIPAIRRSIAAGININITLIFSLVRYAEVIEAYFSGLEERLKRGLAIDHIASVASFFVSRVDTKVDLALQNLMGLSGMQSKSIEHLMGKAAIANARLAYAQFENSIHGQRFSQLRSKGAQIQRPLWASTSTKNPKYRDVLYVEELIGPNTINTMPPQTLEAFREHGVAKTTVNMDFDRAQETIDELNKLGIQMDQVTDDLEIEGVKAFADSFQTLLQTIEERRKFVVQSLGPLQKAVPESIIQLTIQSTSERIHSGDPALWTADSKGQAEAKKRLGWLTSPQKSLTMVKAISTLLAECKRDGITNVLLLGMGGSSLAPEVFSMIFIDDPRLVSGLRIRILDSTDPIQVASAARWSTIQKTLYIVSSKSGSTSEITAFMDYFWTRAVKKLGDQASDHFIAITDSGTSLEKTAHEKKFRKIIFADPDVGGRYSALTAFGLVPAGLLNIDLDLLLSRANRMAARCGAQVASQQNPGLVLGSVIGEAFLAGRDKLTILSDPELESFGNWLEQLVAESSGKDGRGIVPIVGEPILALNSYGKDRIFVYLCLSGKKEKITNRLIKAGLPVIHITLKDDYDLGSEFYRWEFAIAVACAIIKVNAFDQPDVQDSKNRTAQKISIYNQTGKMPEGVPVWESSEAILFGDLPPRTGSKRNLPEIVKVFLEAAKKGDYIAINAYVPRNPQFTSELVELRKKVAKLTGMPTTLGFGPRFLHSTGQLHKGGSDNGVFLQITMDPKRDTLIPGMGISFGMLERAQALGDFEALQSRKRRVIRIHLKTQSIHSILG